MSTFTYHYFIEDQKDIPILSPFASRPCAMINSQWLELAMSRTNFHGYCGRGGRGAVTFSRRSIYDYIVLLRYRLKKPRT